MVKTAAEIRRVLGFDPTNQKVKNWEEALRSFVEKAEAAGILVMRSGMVAHHPTRKLEVEEMRGFALADKLAPLVFVNANDAKAAQMFTMAHEIAHLWTGESALSDPDPSNAAKRAVEKWCDEVAAETLLPMAALERELPPTSDPLREVGPLAVKYRVSELVILRRMLDAKRITGAAFTTAYVRRYGAFVAAEQQAKAEAEGGPSFYRTAPLRVSKRFASMLAHDTLAGRTSYRDALRLLGITRVETFRELGRTLGVE